MKLFLVGLILTLLQSIYGFEEQKNFNGLLTSSQLIEWGYDSATTIDLDLSGNKTFHSISGFHYLTVFSRNAALT